MIMKPFYIFPILSLLYASASFASNDNPFGLTDEELAYNLSGGQRYQPNRPEDDADYARRLAQEEADAQYVSRLVKAEHPHSSFYDDDAASLALARQLQNEGIADQDAQMARELHLREMHQQAHVVHDDPFKIAGLKAKLTPAQHSKLDALRDGMVHICQVVVKPIDKQSVHAFNHSIRQFAPYLIEMNTLMGLNPNLTLVDCMGRLRQLRNVLGPKAAGMGEAELMILHDYLVKDKAVEPETGMHSLQLLSMLVDYLERCPDRATDVRIFFERLLENTKEKGGCYPGYVGRLVICNVIYILRHFRNVDITIK
jgi:hypothetical protein